MGSGFDLFGGGFVDVIASTTEPSNPEPFTIWVEDDIEVNKVVVKSKKPTNPVENTLFILNIDTLNNTEFAYFYDVDLSGNELWEDWQKVITAKFYDGIKWVVKSVYMYINSKWETLARADFDIYTGSYDNTIRIVDSAAGLDKREFVDYKDSVKTLAIDPQGNVYSGFYYGEIRKSNPEGSTVWQKSVYYSDVRAVAVDNEGNTYATSGSTGTSNVYIRKYKPNGDSEWRSDAFDTILYNVAVDKEGNVYVATYDRTVIKYNADGVKVWDYEGEISTHRRYYSIALDSDYNIYIGSMYGVIKLNRYQREQWDYSNHSDNVNSVAVDPGGNVYSGSSDNTVKKLNSNGSHVWTNRGHSDDVNSVAVDNDGSVYSGSSDNTVRKLNSSGSLVWKDMSHSGSVTSVATSPGIYGAFPEFWS